MKHLYFFGISPRAFLPAVYVIFAIISYAPLPIIVNCYPVSIQSLQSFHPVADFLLTHSIQQFSFHNLRCFFVTPLALKYATSLFFMFATSCKTDKILISKRKMCKTFQSILHIHYRTLYVIMSNTHMVCCFMPQKHLFLR